MASKDFADLMKKIHVEKYNVLMSKNKLGKDNTESEITLEKGKKKITLKSSEKDFLEYCWSLEKLPDPNGTLKLIELKDKKDYYENITFFKDYDKKVKKIIEDILSGKNPNLPPNSSQLIYEFISSKDNDLSKYKILKSKYFEIQAMVLLESKRLNEMENRFKEITVLKKDFEEYSMLLEDLLEKAFRNGKNSFESFKLFREKTIDFNKHDLKVRAQLSHINKQRELLTKEGKVDGIEAMPFITDSIRRITELSRDLLDIIRIAIEVTNGIDNPEQYYEIKKNVEIITKDKKYNKLVDCIKPYIRHTESHVDVDYATKGIVIFKDTRQGKDEIIEELTYEDIREISRKLEKALFPAMMFTFQKFEWGLKIILTRDPAYILKLSKT